MSGPNWWFMAICTPLYVSLYCELGSRPTVYDIPAFAMRSPSYEQSMNTFAEIILWSFAEGLSEFSSTMLLIVAPLFVQPIIL